MMTCGPFGSLQYQIHGGAEVKGQSCSRVVLVTSGHSLHFDTVNCFVTIMSSISGSLKPLTIYRVFWISWVAIPDFRLTILLIPISRLSILYRNPILVEFHLA